MSLWFARALRPVLKWLRPVEGALAADSLIQSPRRTSGAVAALMLSLGQVIGLGGVGRESYNSILDWLDTALNPDLFVSGSQNLSDRTFRFPHSLGAKISAIGWRGRRAAGSKPAGQCRGHTGAADCRRHRQLRATGTSCNGGRRPARACTRWQKQGAASSCPTISPDCRNERWETSSRYRAPAGQVRLPIVGIMMDWSDQQGAVLLERTVYEKYWQDDTVNVFRVYVDAGVDPMAVRERLLEQLSPDQPRLLVLTNAEVRSWMLQLTDQWLQLTYSQVFIAVIVAILGIVNTLTVSIIDRKRELGVLRAVGGFRRQIRQTVWMEAVAIGLVGLALGLLFGAANLYFLLQITGRDLSGMYLPYRFPVGIALMLLPTILLAALFSALWPAESAVRTSLVEALEYE